MKKINKKELKKVVGQQGAQNAVAQYLIQEEIKGLKETNNPNLFLDKKGRLYSVEFNINTGEHFLKLLDGLSFSHVQWGSR